MDKYKKASFNCLIVFLAFSIWATFVEFPMIKVHREIYFVGKIFLHLWLLLLCFLIRKDAYRISTNLQVGTMMMAYVIHGQYFSPWYIFAFHQLIIGFSFLFPLPKKIFNIFAVTGMTTYVAMMWYRFDNIHNWLTENSRAEWALAGIAITLVAILSHSFFTSDRNHREALIRKFGLVGLQTATVVHDVKGMLASPRMNIDLLKKNLAGQESPEVQGLLLSIEKQLANISDSIQGLNSVVSLQQQEKEHLKLSEVIQEVAETLNISSRNIQLSVDCHVELITERALIKSVIFNIFVNSIQAFRKQQTADPCIKVKCIKNIVELSDNAGGYPAEILKSLGVVESHRVNGDGMGLFLISTGVQSLGGRATFSNTPNGAQVSISFPILNPRKRLALRL